MKTMTRIMTLTAALLMVVPALSVQAADTTDGPAGPGGHGAKAVARLEKHEAHIQKHMDKLNAALTKHTQWPANVQSDVQKLLQDLKAKDTTIGQLISDIQAHDKTAAKADRATLKTERATCKTDRSTLKTDRQAFRAARKAAHAGKHHKGQTTVN
ncbi:MAG: hypothetical protein ACREJ2_01470 [Planctomycetota bacterium]